MRPLLSKIAAFLRPKRRWYRLTPDRFLIGLLAVESFLLLSEWFSWFPFKKGWTVLIAMGTVCGAVLFLLLWFVVSLIFRRRFQFSIRSLLVFVLLCAVACSWFTVKMQQARRQREAVEAVLNIDGSVGYDYEEDSDRVPGQAPKPAAPAWAVEVLGVDFFSDVVSVTCPRYVGNDSMKHLRALTNLKWLNLGGTQITDAGLEHLKGLTNLKYLHLQGTQVTDAGLEHLKALTNLIYLDLYGTQTTDAGLEHLRALTNLPALNLKYTQVTDEGLEHVRALTNLIILNLYGTQITDAGLERLKGLASLQRLDLRDTQVTDEGLEHLKGLTSLQELHLGDTQVTGDGVKKLQQALPNCKIRH